MPDNDSPKPSRVFGPVPSRRLGRSLGVDIIPSKTCPFDCVYCQVGRTTCHTVERKPYVDREGLVEEIRAKLDAGARPDVITLAGSGEPTLHSELGAIIDDVKRITDVPVAVLTNGALLYDPAVRADCGNADLVLPSLDAGDEAAFRRINRPCESLTLERVVEGLVAFRREYPKPIWLEVFFLDGVNTDDEQVAKMGRLIERIRPDKVHLNTAVRPTCEAFAARVSESRMGELCAALGPKAEVIADYSGVHGQAEFQAQQGDVLDMLRRRPCTADDLAAGLGMHRNHVLKFVETLEANGSIRQERRGSAVYYVAAAG